MQNAWAQLLLVFTSNWLRVFAALVVVVLLGSIFGGIAQAANSYSASFNRATAQYFSVLDANQTGLDLVSDFTIEAWVKPASLPAINTIHSLETKWDETGNNRNYAFVYYNIAGTPSLTLSLNYDGQAGHGFEFDMPYNLGTNTWHHVAVTYNIASGIAEFFVDGSSIGTLSGGPITLADGAGEFRIGSQVASDFPGATNFDGKIDDVRVWNVQRSASEIANNRNVEISGSNVGLQGYWKLNNTLTDETFHGNLLANNGATFTNDVPFDPVPPFTSVMKVVKTANESVASSNVPQDDDQLVLTLESNKTYIIDGVILASTTSATPDIKLAFTAPSGASINLGYVAIGNAVASGGVILQTNTATPAVKLPANTPTPVHVQGTITTSSQGDVRLRWAQNTSNAKAVGVMKGSYLRAEAI